MSAHPRLLSRLETFLASERGRRILNRFYSWGAAFVILGALFKLLHIRYGDEILLVSMLTEFVVFFISGFERPEKSYDWEAVFPELRGAEEVPLSESIARREALIQRAQQGAPAIQSETCASPSTQPLVSQQTLSSEEVEHLREAIDRLGEAAAQLARIGSVSSEMTKRYELMALDYSKMSQHSAQYLGEMESLARNVTGLNAIYELQLKSISSQVETIDRINSGLQHIRQMYEGGLPDSEAFGRESAHLTQQLTQLNDVYARLLRALTVNMTTPGAPHTPYTASPSDQDDHIAR